MHATSFPYFAGAVGRIAEVVGEGFHHSCAARPAGQETSHQREERQSSDPLRSPVGTDPGTGDSPNLFRITAEKGFVEPSPESANHPVFEGLHWFRRETTHPEVTERA